MIVEKTLTCMDGTFVGVNWVNLVPVALLTVNM